MIRSISFQKEFIPLIEKGRKTVTRRIKFTGIPGDIFYFKAGRLGKKEGYIKIINITKDKIKDSFYYNEYYPHEYPDDWTQEELDREGSFDIIQDFIDLWNKLNKKSYKWENNPMIYRIEFEYLGENEP